MTVGTRETAGRSFWARLYVSMAAWDCPKTNDVGQFEIVLPIRNSTAHG